MNNFYVYAILDPRYPGVYKYENHIFDYLPYYIGKGKDDRYLRSAKDPKQDKKFKIYNDIIDQGSEPKTILVFENLTEIEAFKQESVLVQLIGRKDENSGPLINKTNGGEGLSGHKLSMKTKQKMSKSRTGRRHWHYGIKKKNKYELIEESIVKVILTQNQTCLVDKKNWDWLKNFTWYAMKLPNGKFTVTSQVPIDEEDLSKRKTVYMHTLLKKCPRGHVVFFKDDDSMNLKEKNLNIQPKGMRRILTNIQINNKSGYPGINIQKGKWHVRISYGKKRIHIGFFDLLEDAKKAYDEAFKKHYPNLI